MAIYPKTYEEVMRFKRCLQMKTYVAGVQDELVEKAYHFLGENPGNKISASEGMLSFTDLAGNVVFNTAAIAMAGGATALMLTGQTISVTRPYIGGGGGDGGTSGNNNNNNNNNNNG